MTTLLENVTAMLDEVPADFGGGCSVSKAYMMAYLIRRFSMKRSLDIGVYRGRSLFPQALAHAKYTSGVVFGVDPWNASDAVENDNPEIQDQIEQWAASVDFEGIYQDVRSFISGHSLEDNCTLVRLRSEDAIAWFREQSLFFDMIHVDGNHDTEKVMADLDLYLPVLNRNGFMFVDDISWDSVRPAYDRLLRSMSLVFENSDGGANDYAVFWRNRSPLRNLVLKSKLKSLWPGNQE